jgi:hypothetical protein
LENATQSLRKNGIGNAADAQFTSQIASFSRPSIEQQVLFAALEQKPDAASRFFGALTGSVSLREFFSPASLFRILGLSGLGRVLFGKLIPSQT